MFYFHSNRVQSLLYAQVSLAFECSYPESTYKLIVSNEYCVVIILNEHN